MRIAFTTAFAKGADEKDELILYDRMIVAENMNKKNASTKAMKHNR